MPSRRWMAIFWPVLALTVLVGTCFHAPLFRGEQFAYRDAAHYYYPLHLRTAEQWRSGRLPLWDPSENGGMPLLGNPTAAVLYPGKLVFAILPYPWAARIYLIGHILMAFAAMKIYLRGLGISGIGSSLGGLSYAFGGPVLFEYCNAIYLVGSAWLPLGFLAVDGWLRRGKRWSGVGLAMVLAMQSLGGDLQTPYVLGLFAAIYAIWLHRAPCSWPLVLRRIALALAFWFVGTVFVAFWLPGWREWGVSATILEWLNRLGKMFAILVLVAIAFRCLGRPIHRGSRGLLGLIAAAVVGFCLAGAQMVPVAEMAMHSARLSGEKEWDVHAYSTEPYRLVEALWPGVFGVEFPEDRLWLLAIPPVQGRLLWTASLYAGGLTLVLAIAGLRSREAPSWRSPMACMGLAALLLAMGRFGGPLWWVRWFPPFSSMFGGLDPGGSGLFRRGNGQVHDAFASPYWLLSWLAPGFGGFRFPSKFLGFALLAFSTLAALGWDVVGRGWSRPALRSARFVAGLSIVGLVVTLVFGSAIIARFQASARLPSMGGPLDPVGALFEIRRAMVHGLIVSAASACLVVAAAKGRRFAGPMAILLMAIDLAVANSRIVWSVPQAEFDREPMALRVLSEADAKAPQPGPYRIHRIPVWQPVDWVRHRSPDRLREIVAWERDSLKAGYASPYGVPYVVNPDNIEPIDFLQLVDAFPVIPEPESARMVQGEAGASMYYYPRRSFDMWGARYFLLPSVGDEYTSPQQAIAAFFFRNVEPVFPLGNHDDRELPKSQQDWRIVRNLDAYPRAWVVHEAHVRETLPEGSTTTEARNWRTSILYKPDPFWQIPGRPVEDARQVAWIEVDDPKSLRLDLGESTSASETVTFEHNEPDRVELSARLDSPGLVVLSDSYDPGWKLTLDGRPATILRANRMMRAAAVPAGSHRLVYSYEPFSFRVGLVLSALGVLGLAALGLMKPPECEEPTAWAPSKPLTTPPTSA